MENKGFRVLGLRIYLTNRFALTCLGIMEFVAWASLGVLQGSGLTTQDLQWLPEGLLPLNLMS